MASEYNDKKNRLGSRAERRSPNKEAEEFFEKEGTENTKPAKMKVRLIPVWLRLLIVAILVSVSLMVGLIVGYGVIGEGNPVDALKKSTWDRLVELVIKEDV